MRIRSLPLCIGAAVTSGFLLALGWVWARLLLSHFQRREGVTFLNRTPNAAHYELWGLLLPGGVTANACLIVALISLFTLGRRREFFLLTALSGYFLVLAGTYLLAFASLSFAAFD
jgi:hypothetical protein